ncbi:uncharacterized protein LOC127862067 isoform X2 [Dreissena polymorpha]|nr:uncharacterized protein LOC127862067 isoform X2 [Dreissena polymorpha]
MEGRKRLRVPEVNPHVICVLCGGYYIDATTIIECLHTFCKTCIVGYLEASKHCPVCDNLVHKTKPQLRLRPDHTLQDIVYKLIPGLFQDEMRKRREFYKEEIENGRVGEHGIPEERERIIYSADEQISLVLELSSDGTPPLAVSGKSRHHKLEASDRRYLLCPGKFTVGLLKKFVRMKFSLCDRYQIDFFHTDETLRDHFTLVDIAYIYSWRRKGPLRLFYSVFTNPAKRFKADDEIPAVLETDDVINDITNTSDLKTETSGYITDDDKLHSDLDKSASLESDESKVDSVLEGDGLDIDNEELEKDKDTETSVAKAGKPDQCESETEHDRKKVSDKRDQEKASIGDPILVSKPESSNFKNERTCSVNVNNTSQQKNSSHLCHDDKQKDVVKHGSNRLSVDKCDTVLASTGVGQSSDSNSDCARKDSKVKKANEKHSSETEIDCGTNKHTVHKFTENDQETHNKVETSTNTVPCSNECARNNQFDRRVLVHKEKRSKSCFTDDDISEPVVSSTQNTQGCQTESHENNDSEHEKLDIPDSNKEYCKGGLSPGQRLTADVSCETDNFIVDRQQQKDNVKHEKEKHIKVSVSTYTESESADKKLKFVDSATDVYDFPKSDIENEDLVTLSAHRLSNLSYDSSKRTQLSVDCSVSLDDIQSSSSKRKYNDLDEANADSKPKISDVKIPKRSISYSGQLTPKTAYLAQPLSPTKITLKFAPRPKSPTKIPCPKSPSRSETTGFQSKYQSFVMDLPEKTYRFEDDEKPIEKNSCSKSFKYSSKCASLSDSSDNSYSQSSSSKRSFKTNRPRGRPPKSKLNDEHEEILAKDKKIKSRSHSPKQQHSTIDGVSQLFKTKSVSSSGDLPKCSNTYSWIHRLSDTKSAASSPDSKVVIKSKLPNTKESPPPDLRIPKQLLCFTNGQYTLTTVSNTLSTKQSSPMSPPPRTVFTSDWKGKSKEINKNASAIDSKCGKETKTDKVNIIRRENKTQLNNNGKVLMKVKDIKKEKADDPRAKCKRLNTGYENNQQKIASAKVKPKVDMKVKKDAYDNKTLNQSKSASQNNLTGSMTSLLQTPTCSQSSPIPSCISTTRSHPAQTICVPSSKAAATISKGTKLTAASSKPIDSPHPLPASSSSLETEPSASSSASISRSESKSNTTTAPMESTASTLPEYRHQSPFFTSLSGAKLSSQQHRTPTHLNVPNLANHFSGAHSLYSSSRFHERLAIPNYRFSMNPKTASSMASKLEEARALEAIGSHYNFMAHFADPYYGFMNSHLVSLLPPPPHLASSVYQSSTNSLTFSEHSAKGSSSSPAQNSNRASPKSFPTNGKVKEKSLDKVITAITEMRTKKETQEQLTGMDLSTKGSKKDNNADTNGDDGEKAALPTVCTDIKDSESSTDAKITHVGNGENCKD